jgi:hypothetical protein
MPPILFPGLAIGALVVVILLVVPYVVGPIMVKFTMNQRANPDLRPFDLAVPRLEPEARVATAPGVKPVGRAPRPPLPVPSWMPRPVAAYFHKVRAALEPLGFEVVRGLVLPNQVPRVRAIVLLLANRPARDCAMATAMYAEDVTGTDELKTTYVEFSCRFDDGSIVMTQNSPTLGAFAPRPKTVVGRLPMVQDPARLYRLHAALAAREGRGKTKGFRLDEEFGGDAAAFLSRSMYEELEAQVHTGYYSYSWEDETFRPTWKGAVLMTYGLLPPFKAVRLARRARAARELVAELEGERDLTQSRKDAKEGAGEEGEG